MTMYYPQAAMSLRILFENFGKLDPLSNQEYSLNVTPRSVTVSINDYTKADTFSCEIDYKNFPFDPRTIRACGVTVFIEDMRAQTDQFGRPKIIQPVAPDYFGKTNAIFIGFADENNIEFDEAKRTVRLSGRDFTALYIDTPYDIVEPLSLATPLENVFAFLSARLKATRDMKVLNKAGDTLPSLGQFAPDFNALSAQRNKSRNESYWDVIQDLARRAGLIVYVELDKLIINKPNALYDRKELKQFVWGKNLNRLAFSRKLGRVKNFNIEVRSMNIEKKEVLKVKIPEEASLPWVTKTGIPRKRVQVDNLLPNGTVDKKDANFIVFRLPDIASKTHLTSVAENIFEELGRQQIEGSLETRDMCVREGNVSAGIRTPGVEFDVTKIRNATPIDIRIQQDDIEAIAREKDRGAKVKYLIDRCYDPSVAYAFADSLGKFDTPFYTKAVEFTLSQDQGFKMRLEFINFIELPQSLVRF